MPFDAKTAGLLTNTPGPFYFRHAETGEVVVYPHRDTLIGYVLMPPSEGRAALPASA